MNASPSKARFDYDHFANVLSNERDRLGLTREQVGDIVQVDTHTLAALERGAVRPDIVEYARLCAWMKCSLDEFIVFDVSGEDE